MSNVILALVWIFTFCFFGGCIFLAISNLIKNHKNELARKQRNAQMFEVSEFVRNLKQKELEQFTANNHIIMIEDSCSSLGLCGISDEFLFYGLNKYEPSYAEDIYAKKACVIAPEKISLDSIRFYRTDGNLHYTSNVEGGGVNVHGAIEGALFGGSVGAIIGSQIGTEIRTDIVAHDNRKLTIFYEEDNSVKSLQVNSYQFDKTIAVLRKLIPQKEEAMAILESSKPNAASNPLAVEALKELKELLDSGIITQEEFEAKKKQILGL